jgi:signal transduction histidine kinase
MAFLKKNHHREGFLLPRLSEWRQKLKGDRKYFAIVFFILFLIFLSGIITPVIVSLKETYWNKELSGKISSTEQNIKTILNSRQDAIVQTTNEFKFKLSKTLNSPATSFKNLIELINQKNYIRYSIEVIAPNGKLIAWNRRIAIPQEDIFPLTYPPGETYFYNTELTTYLSVLDTLHVDNDIFYFIISQVVEKHYNLQTPYFNDINLSKDLSGEFSTKCKVYYSPFAVSTKDGRKYSFEIINNANQMIGLVTIQKPLLTSSINSIYDTTRDIQAVLVILALVFAMFGFKRDFQSIKYKSLRLLLFIIFCAAFREIIYYVGFPSSFLSGPLTDPSYFASPFAGGIVRSPVEFFITCILLLFIGLLTFKYVVEYYKNVDREKFKFLKAIGIIPLILIFLLTLRGFSASIRSIVFDSSLRYFKEPNLIPNFPALVMNLNILLFGIAVVLVLCSMLILVLSFLPFRKKKEVKVSFFISFFIYEILGVIFIQNQEQPLINIILILVMIFVVYLLLYQILFIKINSVYNYVYITLAASIISITLLNYFNLELERESLKTTVYEINRPNDNLLRFLVIESLKSTVKNPDTIISFGRKSTNYDALAFLLWSNSPLQREALNSSLSIFNKDKKYIGRFTIGLDTLSYLPSWFENIEDNSPRIVTISNPASDFDKIFVGIIPVKERDITIGYISAAINYNLQNIGNEKIPPFLRSGKNLINSVLDVKQLKIFRFSNDILTQVYGDIYPSRDQIKPILNADFTRDNEAWMNLTINGENYLTYVLKTESKNSIDITAALVMKKHFTWNLFNFFKIFIIHSIFIFILFSILFIINLRRFKYSFRTQLLFAFLFISIIPVVVLAVYNHRIVEERTQNAVLSELNETSSDVEGYVRNQLSESKSVDLITAFEKASNGLGASFTVYESSDMIFSSEDEYYSTGILSEKINPDVYYQLYYLNYKEYLIRERIESYPYHSLYRRVSFGDKNLVIGVNDAFSKIDLNFSTLDIDIFLFGIYSFAVIIIILISTLLANRISAPIRKLTKATSSVAHGDLNVELISSERGEIKDLYDSFNIMTKELQKNQADLAALERENAWKEMAKQVAHEIKNPLTPMKLAVQQLVIAYKDKKNDFENIFDKITKTVLNQIESLSSIAGEFSRFAKMPSPKLEEMDLVENINSIHNLYVEEIKIEVQTDLKTAMIEGDDSQLRRIFINLIRNSIQANANFIILRLSSEEDNYLVEIIDNGNGIPEGIKEKIFETNFTTKKKGMGIGLKLAKRFLESITGDIYLIESDRNGTSFGIRIPKLKPVNNKT